MSSEPILSGSELTEEITRLRKGVLIYEPGKVSTCADRVEFPEQLYIGLFGRTGCGKTSLINSLKFAANGKLRRSQWQQTAGQEKVGGHNLFRKLADITKKIFVIDNRGLDDPNTEKAIEELAAQLDGKRGYSKCIEWQRDSDDLMDEDLDLSDLDLNLGHPIGCVVIVFNAHHNIETNIHGLADVIDLLHSHQGRYPLAIITHVDVAEKNHVEDLKAALRASGVSVIFEVANLTSEKKLLEEPYQHSLLSLLERCMTDGDETLVFKHHQRKDQQRKKEFARRREEKRRKQEEERIAEECRQMAEKERIERENQVRRESEEQRRAIKRERERERAEKERIERENQMRRELEEQRRLIESEREWAEKQERERREQEKDQRHKETIKRAEAEKQAEIRRIMEAKKKDESSCKTM